MSEEREQLPNVDFKDIPFMGSLKIKLDCAKAIKSGEGKFGKWFLWFGLFENVTAYNGRKPNQEKVANYTGKAIFFPTEKLSAELEKAANGMVGAVVLIKKSVEEGKKGLIKKYSVEKIAEGTESPRSSSDSLTPGEVKLLNDAHDLRTSGIELDEATFIKATKDTAYGNITDERAKVLYNFFMGK